mmetsp:Transcript_734/g.951  ORF Transcript_734/g.951 Transcript_734/m.951 type:complete len:353 (+) Transcript_734:240-1298(+)
MICLPKKKKRKAFAMLRDISKQGSKSLVMSMTTTLLERKMKEETLQHKSPKGTMGTKPNGTNKAGSAWIVVGSDCDLSPNKDSKELVTKMDDTENDGWYGITSDDYDCCKEEEESSIIHHIDDTDDKYHPTDGKSLFLCRFPAAMDIIVIRNLTGTKDGKGDSLCIVESTSLSMGDEKKMMQVTVSACMGEFSGLKRILLFDNELCCESRDGVTIDNGGYGCMSWRFMPSQRLGPAEATKEARLEGLRFVATGVTEEYSTPDTFKSHVKGSVEAAGGRMTHKVSGKTDYVVAGDWRYDPFNDIVGTIESGSKYHLAMTMNNCTVISLDDLQCMVGKGLRGDTAGKMGFETLQ